MAKGTVQFLNKDLVASRFKASAATYDDNAIVQRKISRQLITTLGGYERIGSSRVLEIGCCTGILTRLLCAETAIDNLFLNDLVPDFCKIVQQQVADKVQRVQSLAGDIEAVALPTDLDLVISSSTFQWMADLPCLLDKIALALKNNGHLVFSIFSAGTMEEIRTLTGRGLRYYASDEIAALLADNFQVINLQSHTKTMYFPTATSVLHHIKKTGVGGVSDQKWSLKMFKEFERRYAEDYLSKDGLPVTYVSTFVVAQKLPTIES